MTCSFWHGLRRESAGETRTSYCSNGNRLEVHPLARGAAFVVVRKGHVIRHGVASSVQSAMRAARRQAGATSGLSGARRRKKRR